MILNFCISRKINSIISQFSDQMNKIKKKKQMNNARGNLNQHGNMETLNK